MHIVVLCHDLLLALALSFPEVLLSRHSLNMADIKETAVNQVNDAAQLATVPSYVQEKTEVCADINHVAQLGIENTKELEKKIVRKLDIWMLPQLWILYMFNYLNRTNIAQARLNTFNEDLNLKDGDYQVC